MKIRVADFIAEYLVNQGICDAFSVTGGGAMHLNDALGHVPGLHVTYNHHEQACAIAAEAYARMNNHLALVCVTTGPGGTNAITGVVGGWLDSIPMLIISGQVRYDTTARGMGVPIRAGGDQEFDIIKAIDCMTKYSEMLIDPLRVKYCLDKALYLSQTGRPGPCWIDVPLNVQGSFIETDDLIEFDTSTVDTNDNSTAIPKPVSQDVIDIVLGEIEASERPVFYAGNGIRIAKAYSDFLTVIRKLNIPVVTGWDSIDQMPGDDPLYVGRGGMMGDRAGNFAVQNADLILAVGNRLSLRQVGYTWDKWARAAKVIMVDADEAELRKPTLHVEMPICADAKDFLMKLNKTVDAKFEDKVFTNQSWLDTCNKWKINYPTVCDKHHADCGECANVYSFIGKLSHRLPEGYTTIVGNGSACVVGSHGYEIKKDSRFIINSAIASMGYDLPASIGACIAIGNKEVVCVTGDGSIQMNIQELQTIITNKLPIKIFVINNQGYHSIRQTQSNIFGHHSKVGIGPESGDLEFPSMEKLSFAYGYPYVSCRSNTEIDSALDEVFAIPGACICEIFVSTTQLFEPKSATKQLPDGKLVSPPLEDLAPFLSREELKEIMFIPWEDEE